jgi:hypothetical protein
MEVAATLAAMTVWGTAVVGMVVSGILGTRVIIHNPVHAFAAAQYCAVTMHDGALNLGEEDLAPCVAECHHTNECVRFQSWDDVGKACHGWELG